MEPAGLSTSKNPKYSHPYISALIDLSAGAAGGTASVAVGQPLDTVKVKMQSFPHLYKTSWFCFRQTLIKDGVKGLYAGTTPSLLANVAENSVLFCAYGVCQKAVQTLVGKPKPEDLGPLENASAGFLAAFFSSFALCPTELIKCRLQALREVGGPKIGPWKITRQVIKTEGLRGLFCGLVPTFAREMPGYFFFFGGYEVSRELLTPPGKTKDEIGPLRTIISGGFGGIALWASIFPFDVIKSRVQITNSKESMLSMMRTIVKIEGIRALYNGLGPTLLRTFPATGALFLAYETTKKLFTFVDD